jgi:hypothetical protein
MIHFFRRIRRALLSESKYSRYAFYALGEIALVMIGILLALQVNNWNNARQDLKKELRILENLKQEFESNKILIDTRQQNRIASLGPNKAYNELLKTGNFTYDDIAQGPGRLDFATTNPSYGVLNSLISSSDLALIQPDSLRYSISNWKESLMDFLEDEMIKTSTLVKWTQENAQKNFPGADWGDYTKEHLRKIYVQEARKIDYRNSFSTYCSTLEVAIQSCQRIQSELDDIVKLINIRISELDDT